MQQVFSSMNLFLFMQDEQTRQRKLNIRKYKVVHYQEEVAYLNGVKAPILLAFSFFIYFLYFIEDKMLITHVVSGKNGEFGAHLRYA